VTWRVGDWVVEPELDEIRRGQERLRLEPRSMALLIHLIERAGHVVSADQLLDNVWKGVVVAPSSVYQTIAQLRRALGDDADAPRYIENVPRKGYRLIAPVERVASTVGRAGSGTGVDVESTASTAPRRRSWRWWQFATAAVLLFVGMAYLLAPESLRQRFFGGVPERSLAVLPFHNLGPDARDAYLADGLTEDLISNLGRLPGVDVTARSSVFAFRERDRDAREIGAQLGARYLLDGSMQRAGAQLRINAQLVDARTGFELWSESYDRSFDDVLRVQEDIARSVARELEVLLTRDSSQRLAQRAQARPAAFDAYLRGRALWNERSARSLPLAREQFMAAIEHDGAYAPSHVALAELYAVLPLYGVESPDLALPKARAAALRALELDDELAEARATLAVVRYQYDWDWPGAEAEFRRAIALNPSYATARQWYAEFLAYSGRYEEAKAQIALAFEFDPLSPTIFTLRGSPALWAHRYEEAEQNYRAAAAAYPAFGLAHYSLGLSLLGLKRAEDAVAAFENARRGLSSDFVAPSLAHAYAALGRVPEARALLEQVSASVGTRYVSPYKLAVLHAAVGEHEPALDLLEQALRIHDDRLVLLAVDPLLDSLRAEPRFAKVFARTVAPRGAQR